MGIPGQLRGLAMSLATWVAVVLAGPSHAAGEPALEEAFVAAQWAYLSSAGKALQQIGLRAAAGSDELAALVRKRQDIVAERERTSKLLETADADALVRLRGEIDVLTTEISLADAEIRTRFPDFDRLANPEPLTIAEVRRHLDTDEALLFILSGRYATYVFAISKTGAAWVRSPANRASLAGDVAALRATLDPAALTRGLDGAGAAGNAEPKLATFDRTRAWLLYAEMIRPVEHVLDGVNHVFVVADGPLSGLPLSLLIAEDTLDEGAGNSAESFRRTNWLFRRYALTTLPSVESVAILRGLRGKETEQERRPFAGFGAPAFGGSQIEIASAASGLFRGALADPDAVRDLAPLPNTRRELVGLAASLGASAADIVMGEAATERAVKAADLRSARVIAFATHGLLSGELPGLAEPALAFTPPAVASLADDGLLTASEIAALDLDADWVILSACNTAGSDGGPDGEGLSGLARAFLYAGARAILVSHWPVRDDAAARLTTGAVAALSGGEPRRRAEALRQAMIDLLEDESDPTLAHPSAWAPFVVVGEGGY